MALTFKQLFSSGTKRWQQCSVRERTAVRLMLAAVVIASLWMTVVTPQRQALQRADEAYTQELALRTLISQLPSAPAAAATLEADKLPGLLTRSSSEAHLKLERMDTDATGQTNLNLTGSLENLLPWLEQLGRQGVNVHSLSLATTSDQQLSVQVTLQAL